MKLGKHQKAMLEFVKKCNSSHAITSTDGGLTYRIAKRLADRGLLVLIQVGSTYSIAEVGKSYFKEN